MSFTVLQCVNKDIIIISIILYKTSDFIESSENSIMHSDRTVAMTQ